MSGNKPDMEKRLYWRRILGEAATSGISVREFCQQRRLKQVQFYWWRRMLTRGGQERRVGTFQFPFAETGRKEIAAWELSLLLEGIDLSKGQRRKRYSLPTGRPESSATIGPQTEPETS